MRVLVNLLWCCDLPHIPLCFLQSQRRSIWHWRASINLLLTVQSRTSVVCGEQFWLVVLISTLKGKSATGEIISQALCLLQFYSLQSFNKSELLLKTSWCLVFQICIYERLFWTICPSSFSHHVFICTVRSHRQHNSYVTLPVLCTRCTCIDTRHAQKACRKWILEMDVALVQYINRLCRHLAITPARLHPHEVYLDPSDIADPRVACLLSNSPLSMWSINQGQNPELNTHTIASVMCSDI